jgi:hypothetical protein
MGWTEIGLVATTALGIFNLLFTYRLNKRNIVVGTLTKDRTQWIDGMRDDISNLNGLIFLFLSNKHPLAEDSLRNIARYISSIRLRISPRLYSGLAIHGETDNLLLELQELICLNELTQQSRNLILDKTLELTIKGQDLINVQRTIIKRETRD